MGRQRVARYTIGLLYVCWILPFAWWSVESRSGDREPPDLAAPFFGCLAILLGSHLIFFRRENAERWRGSSVYRSLGAKTSLYTPGFVAVLGAAAVTWGVLMLLGSR